MPCRTYSKLWLKKEEIDETKPINRYLFTMLKNDLLNTLRDSKKNIYLLEDCLFNGFGIGRQFSKRKP